MNIHIKNGRLIDPRNNIDTQQDVFIVDQRIAAIGTAPQGFVAERVIDAGGLIVMPGLVDVAARLREPGYEYKATLESEMDAAMAGGVTSLSCPPDTDPPLDEPGLVEMLKHRARLLNQARVFPVDALTYGLKGTELAKSWGQWYFCTFSLPRGLRGRDQRNSDCPQIKGLTTAAGGYNGLRHENRSQYEERAPLLRALAENEPGPGK